MLFIVGCWSSINIGAWYSSAIILSSHYRGSNQCDTQESDLKITKCGDHAYQLSIDSKS